MVRVLAVQPGTALADIEAALARTRAPRVALSFPARRSAQLADEQLLHALAAVCGRLGKQVLIVGGDDTLRALAVAAGFAVATSLDDAEPPSSSSRGCAGSPDLEAWEEAEATFLVQRAARATLPLRMDNEPAGEPADEPPDYVRHLLERSGAYPGPRDDDTTPARRVPRVTRPLEPLDDDELLRFENESHEDRVTRAIRHTGGLTPSAPWLAPRNNGGGRAGPGAP